MKLFFSFFFSLFCSLVFSQKKENFSKSSNFIQLDYFYGNILPLKNVKHLVINNPEGFLFTWNKRASTKKGWEQYFNYPDIGFSIGYQDFKNESLGKLYSAYAHYNFYFFNRNSKNKLLFGIGFGAAYATNSYHKITNNKNIALGSRLNTSTYLRLFYKRENIIENIGLQAGLSLIHVSNGSFKAPNKGINTYALNIGLNYDLNSKKQTYTHSFNKTYNREPIHFNTNLYLGINESDVIDSGMHPFFNLSVFVDKRLNRKTALQFGTELHFHYYLKDFIRFKYIFEGDVSRESFPDWKRISLFAGHELFINRISIITQIGYYLYSPAILEENFYQRIAVKIYLRKHYFTSLGIKAHFTNAESLEFGIGYRF